MSLSSFAMDDDGDLLMYGASGLTLDDAALYLLAASPLHLLASFM